jgi:hypothetical protein
VKDQNSTLRAFVSARHLQKNSSQPQVIVINQIISLNTPFNRRKTPPNRQNPSNFWRDISGLSMP